MRRISRLALLAVLCFSGFSAGCGGKIDEEVDLGVSVAHMPEDLSLCVAPPGRSFSDIESVVEWINAMPKPLTLACFVASLPRPIMYNATSSILSLQPAVGKHNPRIFIKYGNLWLSFVPQEPVATVKDPITGEDSYTWDVDGIQLLEMSLEVETNYLDPQSIKGELTFPVMKNLPLNAAYARIVRPYTDTESTCSGCHGSELAIDTLDGVPVFRSKMLRSTRSLEITHAYLVNQYLSCDPAINTGRGPDNNEWYRCQMLEALLGPGSLTWTAFPDEVATFIHE